MASYLQGYYPSRDVQQVEYLGAFLPGLTKVVKKITKAVPVTKSLKVAVRKAETSGNLRKVTAINKTFQRVFHGDVQQVEYLGAFLPGLTKALKKIAKGVGIAAAAPAIPVAKVALKTIATSGNVKQAAAAKSLISDIKTSEKVATVAAVAAAVPIAIMAAPVVITAAPKILSFVKDVSGVTGAVKTLTQKAATNSLTTAQPSMPVTSQRVITPFRAWLYTYFGIQP